MSIVLPAKPSPETNAPDGQVNFSGRDDLDHASDLPEPQGEGQLGSLVNQNQSLGNTEVPVGRSHFADVSESNSENTEVTDETDSGRTDTVDETTDTVREEETDCGNVAGRDSVGGPSNAQSYTDHAQAVFYFRQSQDHPVNEVEQDGSVAEQTTERQNIENQDTPIENTEHQNIESQETIRQNIESLETASQNIERQDTLSQNIVSQNTRSQHIGSQISELQITESQITEIHNTGNQIMNSQITAGISLDLSRRHLVGSNREQHGNPELGKTNQDNLEHYREQGQGAGGHSTSMEGLGTASSKVDWETGAQNISSRSLPSTSLEEDQGDLESSVVTRLERTGMAGFRDDLVQTRRRSTDDTSEKRIKEGRYRYSVDITPSSQYLYQKQDMEKYVHDVDQTKLKLAESETHQDSSVQKHAPAPANQDVSSRGKSSTGSVKGLSELSSKQPVHHQTITDQTLHPIENTSTLRQQITEVDEASELEAVLFRASLPSLDDSGISDSGSLSNEARTDTDSLQDSSPEETYSGDTTYGQSILTSSERGTPDGSVQEMKTTEYAQSSLKETLDKPEADVDFPSNAAYKYNGEPTAKMATGGPRGSYQDGLAQAKVSGNDSTLVDQTTSLEVLRASGRTETDTRSLLKKQSVTETISLTTDALEQFPTSIASTALTPTFSEKTTPPHKVTLFDDKSEDDLKSRQTKTESNEKHDPLDKTSEACRIQQDTQGDSRREEYSCHDTVLTVTETMQGTDMSSAFVKQAEHSTASIASGPRSEGSGAYPQKTNDDSAKAPGEPRHTSWLLPACKVIIHLITRAENPFHV